MTNQRSCSEAIHEFGQHASNRFILQTNRVVVFMRKEVSGGEYLAAESRGGMWEEEHALRDTGGKETEISVCWASKLVESLQQASGVLEASEKGHR